MTDKPRPWPNVAREVRDSSAEDAVAGIKALEPIVISDRPMTDAEVIRRVATGLNYLERIARRLESVGAQTRA